MHMPRQVQPDDLSGQEFSAATEIVQVVPQQLLYAGPGHQAVSPAPLSQWVPPADVTTVLNGSHGFLNLITDPQIVLAMLLGSAMLTLLCVYLFRQLKQGSESLGYIPWADPTTSSFSYGPELAAGRRADFSTRMRLNKGPTPLTAMRRLRSVGAMRASVPTGRGFPRKLQAGSEASGSRPQRRSTL